MVAVVDFRYHLVSIVAVFMALAIGIVVGTTALNNRVLDNLRSNVSRLADDKRELEQRVGDLEARLEGTDEFVTATSPLLLSGRLSGRTVSVVVGPTAESDAVDGLVAAVVRAGGTPGPTVRLRGEYVDPAAEDTVAQAVESLAPGGTGTTTDRAAALLAAALLDPPPRRQPAGTADPVTGDQAAAVLDALQNAGLLEVEGPSDTPAGSLALVVVGPRSEAATATDEAAAAARDAVLALAAALDAAGSGVVVAGPRTAADEGGVLAALRDAGGPADDLSTVDGADTPPGRVATVLALEAETRDVAGAYGTGSGVDAPAPVPTP